MKQLSIAGGAPSAAEQQSWASYGVPFGYPLGNTELRHISTGQIWALHCCSAVVAEGIPVFLVVPFSDDTWHSLQPILSIHPERRDGAQRPHQVQALLPLQPRSAALHYGHPHH